MIMEVLNPWVETPKICLQAEGSFSTEPWFWDVQETPAFHIQGHVLRTCFFKSCLLKQVLQVSNLRPSCRRSFFGFIYHGPPTPTCLEVLMVNNLVFRWPKPLFFIVLGAHGRSKIFDSSFFPKGLGFVRSECILPPAFLSSCWSSCMQLYFKVICTFNQWKSVILIGNLRG